MDSLNEQLDLVLLDYFNTLDQYYQYQANLEESLKAGNLHMSRARYIRGTVSISQCKITEKEMKPSVRVSVSKEATASSEGKENSEPIFTLINSETEDTINPTSDAARKRHVDTGKEIQSPKEEGMAKNERQGEVSTNDPLHWFGVLVPQALRYSQKSYKSAIEQCVELANLQSRIQQIQTKYKNLLHQKNLLDLDKMKIS